MPTPRKFDGRRMKALRYERNLNRDALAALTGIPADGIAKLERNARTPRADTLGLLAAALDCPIDDLYEAAS